MESSYSILANGCFKYGQVIITHVLEDLSNRYSPEVIESINDLWISETSRAYKSATKIYDSNIFRLNEVILESNRLNLQTTNVTYKEYVFYRKLGDKNGGKFKPDPIGTSVLLISADDCIFFGKRSSKVEVNPGRYFTAGGFFDSDLDWDRAKNEPCIFKCMQRELKEELNIEIKLSKLRMLGIVYDRVTPHPEVSFYTHTDKTNEDIVNCFDKNEIENVEFINLNKLDNFVEKNRANIAESLLGALELFKNNRIKKS